MPNSKDFMEMDDKYGAHNYHPIPVVISKAEGVWVYDPEGKKYMDCLSAYSSHNVGHCHPKLVKAIQDSSAKLLNNYECPSRNRIVAAEDLVAALPTQLPDL